MYQANMPKLMQLSKNYRFSIVTCITIKFDTCLNWALHVSGNSVTEEESLSLST